MESGDSIHIIGEPWLLDDHNPFITSNSQTLVQSKVSSLMVTDSRGWDEDILNYLFNDRDQKYIHLREMRAKNKFINVKKT